MNASYWSGRPHWNHAASIRLPHAILTHAARQGVSPAPADDFQVIRGKGATASFQGRTFWLGSHRYLHEREQETEAVHARLEQMSAEGARSWPSETKTTSAD